MSKLAGEGCKIIMPTEERKPLREIEKSIIKKYRKYTFKQAKEKMLETSKYGCWDLEVDYANGGLIPIHMWKRNFDYESMLNELIKTKIEAIKQLKNGRDALIKMLE